MTREVRQMWEGEVGEWDDLREGGRGGRWRGFFCWRGGVRKGSGRRGGGI